MLLAVTLVWALWEAGLDFWPLVARLVAPAVLGLVLLLPFVRRHGGQSTELARSACPLRRSWPSWSFAGYDGETAPGTAQSRYARSPKHAGADGDWKHWGRTLDGNRMSPLGQITNANAGKLELAWQFKSDVAPGPFHGFEATPLAADGKLFVCLDRNVVVALDQETGKQVWRFDARPDLEGAFSANCRGVSWYEAPQGTAECARRILFGVNDGRMMALDAATGQLCRSFGEQRPGRSQAGARRNRQGQRLSHLAADHRRRHRDHRRLGDRRAPHQRGLGRHPRL